MRLSEFKIGDVWLMDDNRICKVLATDTLEVENVQTHQIENKSVLRVATTLPDVPIAKLISEKQAKQIARIKAALKSEDADSGDDQAEWTEIWAEHSFHPYVSNKEKGAQPDMHKLVTAAYCYSEEGRHASTMRTSPIAGKNLDGRKVKDAKAIAAIFPEPVEAK